MIVLDAVFECAPESREQLVALMIQMAANAQTEKGCVVYRFSEDIARANRFMVLELWETEDDLNAHVSTDAFKAFMGDFSSKATFVGTRGWQGPLAPLGGAQS